MAVAVAMIDWYRRRIAGLEEDVTALANKYKQKPKEGAQEERQQSKEEARLFPSWSGREVGGSE